MNKKLLIAGIFFCISFVCPVFANTPDNLTVYPNPVDNGVLNISAGIQIEKVELLNIVGEVVFQQELEPSKNVRVNFDLKKGIYLIRVFFTDNTIGTKKIIVN